MKGLLLKNGTNANYAAKRPRSDAITCSQEKECCQSPGCDIWWSDYNPSQIGNLQSQPESEAGTHNDCLLVQWTDGQQAASAKSTMAFELTARGQIDIVVPPTCF